MSLPFRIVLTFVLMVILYTLVNSCVKEDERLTTIKKYCSSCHLVPEPDVLPKEIWKSNILPVMADHFKWAKPSTYDYANASIFQKKGFIPMTDVEWESIVSYYLENSKDSITLRSDKYLEDKFYFHIHQLEDICALPTVTSIGVYADSILLIACDNAIVKTDIIGSQIDKWSLNDIVTQMEKMENGKIRYLDVGVLDPHDSPLGYLKVLSEDSDEIEIIVDSLFRPVDYIEQDGDIIIAEFGNNVGRVSSHNQYGIRNQISNIPGSYRLFHEDIDSDNASEIIFMSAQALEGVYKSERVDGKWMVPERIIAFPPEFGLSDMDIADINNDGYPDLILANGDNADYSMTLKDYHGIRIYVNDGKGRFEEVFYFPQYGATQVKWIDINGDGLTDFVSSAYFPRYFDNSILVHINISKGLENIEFETFRIPQSIKGRWMVMEKFDIEGDGDQDVILGSYIVGPTPVSESLYKSWEEANIDLLILENQRN